MMDLVEMPFMRYPAMPSSAASMRSWPSTRCSASRRSPSRRSSRRRPPIEEMPSQTGTDLQYMSQLASGAATSSTSSPGPRPAEHRLFRARLPPAGAAAGAQRQHGRAHQRRVAQFPFDGSAKKIIVVTIFDPVTKKIPIPIPVPNLSLLRPPLGARPPLPLQLEFAGGMASSARRRRQPRARHHLRARPTPITGTGTLDVLRYGSAALAHAGRRARRRPRLRRPLLRQQRHPRIKRGEYKQSFTLSRDGLVSTSPGRSMNLDTPEPRAPPDLSRACSTASTAAR